MTQGEPGSQLQSDTKIGLTSKGTLTMALDELVATIETIKQHIRSHRTSLTANETRTRQVLIDPLLRALGWDVTDPTSVELEYEVRGKRADYALLVDGKPVAVIEAKRLSKQLIDDDTMQVMNYANTAGIEYMVVTNGDEWNMYSVFQRGAIEHRLVMELRLSPNPSHISALHSLGMWHPNLVPGSVHTDANIPTEVGISDSDDDDNGVDTSPTVDQEWRSIEGKFLKPEDVNLSAAKFGGREIEISNWKQLGIRFATWLADEGKITPEDCPVQTATESHRYYINIEPCHSDGIEFDQKEALPNGMWLDTFHVPEWWVGNTRRLAQRFDVELFVKVEK